MRPSKTILSLSLVFVLALARCSGPPPASAPAATPAAAASPPRMKMTTDIPPEITTPPRVETHIGTLDFFDGLPSQATVDRVYDNLDLSRATQVFLTAMSGASLVAARNGFREAGIVDGVIGITETLMDPRSLFLTPNTETVYAIAWLDLTNGPVVVESPPNTLGIVDDFWFNYVTDLGNAGPDKGKGGKYLFLPPNHTGDVPKGYYTFKSPTFGNPMFWRGFVDRGDTKPAVANIKAHARVYPLAQAAKPPEQVFVNVSGKAYNTVHASDERFFAEVHTLVQEEPAESQNPEILGLLKSIGIEKGKPFAPDARMQKILREAAAVGSATARALSFRPRDPAAYIYSNSKSWITVFVGGSYEFLSNGARLLDPRTAFFYVATGVTPAMSEKMVGVGSQYALSSMDAKGEYFDGARTYRLRLPPKVPAQAFWSVVLYDPQTRSELQTDQTFPSVGSQTGAVANADDSYDLFFAPKAPAGKEKNWVQTVPGKGGFLLLRLYSPLEPWFDQTWRPGDIERTN